MVLAEATAAVGTNTQQLSVYIQGQYLCIMPAPPTRGPGVSKSKPSTYHSLDELITVTESDAVPRVVVSSVGGSAITVATGTAPGAFETTFAGVAFTAAPEAK